MTSLHIVACELPVRLIRSDDLSVHLSVALWYETGDPYVVRAAFHPVGRSESVDWVFGRDLLAQALSGPAGEGDVRMWPAAGAAADDVLCLALSSPSGSALLELSASSVELFLRQTHSVVPPGAESEHLDLDAELAQLLAGS
jgi:hypothetical protein